MQHQWVLSVADLRDPRKKLRVVREVVLSLPGVAEAHLAEDATDVDTARLSCHAGTDHFYADCVSNHFSAVPKDGRFGCLPAFLRELFLLATSPLERHAYAYCVLRSQMRLEERVRVLEERLDATQHVSHDLASRALALHDQVAGLLAREGDRSLHRYKRKRAALDGDEDDSASSSSDVEDLDSSRSRESQTRRRAQKYPRLAPHVETGAEEEDAGSRSRLPSPHAF